MKHTETFYLFNFSSMYPFLLLSRENFIFPLFWEQSQGNPCIIDYSLPDFSRIDALNQEEVIRHNAEFLSENHAQWWLWWYLENRSHILSGTHILAEWRVYHLGIDVLFPVGTKLHTPLDGEIIEKWYEPGKGNYGWYIIMKYTCNANNFFVLYGHLSERSFLSKEKFHKGEIFAELGSREENGDWFPHLHMQVFTGKDFETWKMKWYCTLEDIPNMRNICPDPTFLIRY